VNLPLQLFVARCVCRLQLICKFVHSIAASCAIGILPPEHRINCTEILPEGLQPLSHS
jgi:hypothetical protein